MSVSSDSLTAVCRRAKDALLVATHLSGIAEEIRHTMPLGYGVDRSHDGIPRPTESLASALDDRGVSDRVLRSRRRLSYAASLIEEAARELDEAIAAWEGVSRSV